MGRLPSNRKPRPERSSQQSSVCPWVASAANTLELHKGVEALVENIRIKYKTYSVLELGFEVFGSYWEFLFYCVHKVLLSLNFWPLSLLGIFSPVGLQIPFFFSA